MTNRSRIRFAAGVAAAFGAGVLFASSLDLVRPGTAQVKPARPREIAEAKPLTDQSNAFVAIAERVTPAVVSIQAVRDPRRGRSAQQPQLRGRQQVPPGLEDFFNQFDQQRQAQPQESSGSGFIVSTDGYILTNNHVVEGADHITVALTDHRSFKGRVIGRDPTTDVAVIKIDGSDLPTVPLGDDDRVRIGEWVLAIGNPLGLNFTVTAGIVSAKGRGTELGPTPGRSQYQISDFIQTDAAINPGNSGGPLVNGRGEVIGINSMIASQTGYYSGYGFAIPVTLARNVMDDLIKHGRVRRAIIGVAIADVTPADAAVAGLKEIKGVKVGAYADENSPAKKAGIEEGDIITRADGKDADRVSTLQRIVRSHEPGHVIDIDVMRFGSRKSFRVKLAEAPGEEQVARGDSKARDEDAGTAAEKLGITVEPLPADFVQTAGIPAERRGVRVASVTPGGAAWRSLFQNDIIFGAIHPSRKAIRSVADLQALLGGMKSGEYVSLQVLAVGQASPNGPVQQATRIVNLRLGGE
ncbi:MAG: trypsin-like peptidase domain-containing protein [Gemmatimonadetes bacterium]|nr:trypsin-like peptidase domain-containing protein [Gemmatimonadota bacterium]